jgi:hypothetical protein
MNIRLIISTISFLGVIVSSICIGIFDTEVANTYNEKLDSNAIILSHSITDYRCCGTTCENTPCDNHPFCSKISDIKNDNTYCCGTKTYCSYIDLDDYTCRVYDKPTCYHTCDTCNEITVKAQYETFNDETIIGEFKKTCGLKTGCELAAYKLIHDNDTYPIWYNVKDMSSFEFIFDSDYKMMTNDDIVSKKHLSQEQELISIVICIIFGFISMVSLGSYITHKRRRYFQLY